jgi:hypothetical protein
MLAMMAGITTNGYTSRIIPKYMELVMLGHTDWGSDIVSLCIWVINGWYSINNIRVLHQKLVNGPFIGKW